MVVESSSIVTVKELDVNSEFAIDSARYLGYEGIKRQMAISDCIFPGQ